MSEFVQVPVPAALVTDVMAFIAARSGHAAEVSTAHALPQNTPTILSPAEPAAQDIESRDWTREQFEMLRVSEAKSVKRFADVLTILANLSPEGLTTSELGAKFDVPGIQLQRQFGPASRWIRNRMGGDMRWPIHWPEGKWAMNEHNATLWKEVMSNPKD